MRPTEIKLSKIENKLTSLIKFFMKNLVGKVKFNEDGYLTTKVQIKKALDHAERIGWIKGE